MKLTIYHVSRPFQKKWPWCPVPLSGCPCPASHCSQVPTGGPFPNKFCVTSMMLAHWNERSALFWAFSVNHARNALFRTFVRPTPIPKKSPANQISASNLSCRNVHISMCPCCHRRSILATISLQGLHRILADGVFITVCNLETRSAAVGKIRFLASETIIQ